MANNTISALNALEVTAVSISNGEWTDSLSWDPPSREELGARVFHEIESLMEHGHSQVLTKDHAAKIVAMASKLLND